MLISAFRLNSPHSYTGRSVLLLFFKNLLEIINSFKRRGLPFAQKIRLKRIKNSKKGKTLLLLGNGPSVLKLDRHKVSESFSELMVVNNYLDLEFSDKLIPDFFCISDPNSFMNNDSKLQKYIDNHKITIIASHFYRKLPNLQNKKTIFFNDKEIHFPFWKNINPQFPRSYSSYTFYKALSVAIYMGYDTIFILGLDNTEFFSYRSNESNEIFLDLENFYGQNSYGKSFEGKSIKSLSGFPDGLAGRLQSYALAYGDLRLFDKFKIINLDPNSLITNFSKDKRGTQD
jgi:hypothetical protein